MYYFPHHPVMSSETEETPQFRVFDLPQLQINSEFEFSEYSDIEYSTEPSTPATPTTPATSLTELCSSVTSLGFSDVMDDTTVFAETQPKKHYKKRSGFAKGNKMAKRRLFAVDTPSKKISLSRPSSGIQQTTRMPSRPIPFNIVTRKGDQTTTKAMFVPHGSELMNIDILCQGMSMNR